MNVKVTQEHLDKSIRHDAEYCVLAVMLKEMFPDKRFQVNPWGHIIRVNDKIVYPTHAQETFAHEFDAGINLLNAEVEFPDDQLILIRNVS